MSLIKTLKDKDGNILYPQTSIDAIFSNDGTTLTQELNERIPEKMSDLINDAEFLTRSTITKNDIELSNVENKSSATIRSEITNENITTALGFTPAEDEHTHTVSEITDLSKSSVGLGNVENKSSATIRGEITSSNVTTALGYTPLNSNLKGANSGLAELDSNGKVPTSQLPSYVDDVLEYSAKSSFPTTGETGKIYVDTSNNKTYRWSGSAYIEISPSLALGETSSTAYRGDRGKTAYDHSQVKDGSNPHGTTFANIASKPTTISGYGITDAKIASGVITLGSNTIIPLTSSSSLNASKLSSGTVPSARLPIATSSAVGGVQVGSGLSVTSAGVLSANAQAWGTITGKPTFATVATSGKYTDLTDKPTIPTATSDLTNDSGFITASSTIYDTKLAWGSNGISSSISPVDMACSNIHSANRFAFAKPAGITIEYSRDGGSTWVDYGASNETKTKLVSGIGAGFNIGGHSSGVTVNDKLRITLKASSMSVYTQAKKLLINLSTNGASGSKVMVETANIGSETSFTTRGTYTIAGWSGWNSIPLNFTFGGGSTQTNQISIIRLTFSITGINSNTSYSNALSIQDFYCIGQTYWTYPSDMAKSGHMYSYDYQKNVTFPAKVTATTFSGTLSGNATTASSAAKLTTGRTLTIGSTGKTFDGSANVSWTLAEIGAAAASHTHSYLPLSGGTLTGNLKFSGTQSFVWDSGDYRQKISIVDDSTADTNVFQFQQSTDGGSTYTTLMAIKDNGTVTATTFEGSIAKTYTATIPTSGWSSSAPYYVDVTVTGILASDTPNVTPTYSGTLSTDQARKENWNKIDRIVTSANKIRIYAFEEVPTTAVPIQLQVVR